MSHDVYYQFLQHPGQARRSGARGGKATVRNRRERPDRTPAEVPEPEAGTVIQAHLRRQYYDLQLHGVDSPPGGLTINRK